MIFGLVIVCLMIGASDSKALDTEPALSRHRREIPPSLTVPELIRFWGYDCEVHPVETRDGYRLGVHRIPRGKDEKPSGKSKPVVLLGHGIISSSSAFAFGPPNNSLGYILADTGYDVWLINSRGTPYSRNHTKFCSTCKEFWDFGWHESAVGDYPAVIDYILAKTRQENLFFVGHSMGCTQYLVLLSELPEYNSKIRAGILLAPAAFMTHSTSSMFRVSNVAETLERVYHLFGQYEWKPHHKSLAWLSHNFCNVEKQPRIGEFCANAAFVLLSLHQEQINKTMGPVYMDHYPAGGSTKSFVHFAQLFNNPGRFAKYDYGAEQNKARYGSTVPPAYALSRVTAKTAIFVGEDDDIATWPDVKHLAEVLPNVVKLELLDFPRCNHLDFLIAIDAGKLIYGKILKILRDVEADPNNPLRRTVY